MKQKKFHTEKQILDEIDKILATAKEDLWKAEQLEKSSKEHAKIAASAKPPESYAHQNQSRIDLDDAARFRKKATRLIEVKAKKLKMTLAEFRTIPMPILGTDVGAIMPR